MVEGMEWVWDSVPLLFAAVAAAIAGKAVEASWILTACQNKRYRTRA